VYCHFGVYGQFVVTPYHICKLGQSRGGTPNVYVDFGIQREIVGDVGTQVDKLVDNLQLVVVDGDGREFLNILTHHFGLFQADCWIEILACLGIVELSPQGPQHNGGKSRNYLHWQLPLNENFKAAQLTAHNLI